MVPVVRITMMLVVPIRMMVLHPVMTIRHPPISIMPRVMLIIVAHYDRRRRIIVPIPWSISVGGVRTASIKAG
jgi:hypothetical protein